METRAEVSGLPITTVSPRVLIEDDAVNKIVAVSSLDCAVRFACSLNLEPSRSTAGPLGACVGGFTVTGKYDLRTTASCGRMS